VRDRSRRTQLTDAAITTLAREGSRGLTHRAVDRAAGVPEGSTSYYFRTRSSLLGALVTRLAELDAAEIPDPPTSGIEAFAEAMAGLVTRVAGAERERQLARFELSLEATRRPELREALVESAGRIHDLVTDRLRGFGIPDPSTRASGLLALVDGVLLDQVTGTGRPPIPPELLRDIFRRALDTTEPFD
jgi:DNA-binding transcriptional regulator YbjK